MVGAGCGVLGAASAYTGFFNLFPGPLVHGDANYSYLGWYRAGVLNRGEFPPWGKYWEFRGEMRASENCCLFKTGDTKWFP